MKGRFQNSLKQLKKDLEKMNKEPKKTREKKEGQKT